jgi:transcriptional regulator with XRE-family HTH domain
MEFSPETPNQPDDSSQISPFASWLFEQRRRRDWTQRELADRAGLSLQQISNLETGRTTNPQQRTRERLEKALGATPAPEVLRAEEQQNAVLGLGALVGFDPYDIDGLPDETGVYVLYDRTWRPVYVGKAATRPVSARIKEHSEKFWFKTPVVHTGTGSYLSIADPVLCGQIEQVLIRFMGPHLLINKQGVDRSSFDDEAE